MPGFDDSWAQAVSSSGWPSALVRAVRADPRALATRRAIDSLREWRLAPPGSRERQWLEDVAEALLALPGRVQDENPADHSLPVPDPEPPDDEAPSPPEEPPTAPLLLPVPRPGETPPLVPPPAPPPGPPPPPSESTETLVPAYRGPPSPRPPASGVRVRALAERFGPLADEILPLPVQRRSRRFWARWREVNGDGGIPREAVESLLRRAGSRPELLAGIIAEVLEADLASVIEFLDVK
ncbi:MAG: hypothetical protein AAFZ18_04900 [Myxococcota bacterium]